MHSQLEAIKISSLPENSQNDDVNFVKSFITKHEQEIYYGILLLHLLLAIRGKKGSLTIEFSQKIADSLIADNDKRDILANAIQVGTNHQEISHVTLQDLLASYIPSYARCNHLSYIDALVKFKTYLYEMIKKKHLDLSENIFISQNNTVSTKNTKQRKLYVINNFAKTDEQLKDDLEIARQRLNNEEFWLKIYQEMIDRERVGFLLLNKMRHNLFKYVVFGLLSLVFVGLIFQEFIPPGTINHLTSTLIASPVVMIAALAAGLGILKLNTQKADTRIAAFTNYVILKLLKEKLELKVFYVNSHKDTKQLKPELAIALTSRSEPTPQDNTEPDQITGLYKLLAAIAPNQLKAKKPTKKQLDNNNTQEQALLQAEPKKRQVITWSLPELNIEFSIQYDPSTHKTYSNDEKDITPSSIRRVSTKDNKNLFCFFPNQTLAQQIQKKRQQMYSKNFARMAETPSEADLRPLQDGIKRKVTIGYRDRTHAYPITREAVDSAIESREYGFDITSQSGREILVFFPKFSKGLHTKADKNKTSFGKVEIQEEDIAPFFPSRTFI